MILVFNAGSSSLKAKLFDEKLREVKSFKIERIGSSQVKNHTQAAKIILAKLQGSDPCIIGHRVVHGGDKYKSLTEINSDVIAEIEKLSSLAPLHNPPALEVIKTLKHENIKTKQYACFDTAFFTDLPLEAKVYPLPYIYYKKGIKKYGFHGISHQYAAQEAGLKNLITIHLGAGCSMAVLQNGRVIETSMGFTPNEGLMMMTRCGSIDPGVILTFLRKLECRADEIEEILSSKSGVLGISGVSDDMRDVLFVAGIKVEDKNYVMPANIKCDREHIKRSKLAIEMFCRTVKKYIGGYAALLNNKVDCLVFTGEIGYGSSILRKRICNGLDYKIITVKPDEELAIAREILDEKYN